MQRTAVCRKRSPAVYPDDGPSHGNGQRDARRRHRKGTAAGPEALVGPSPLPLWARAGCRHLRVGRRPSSFSSGGPRRAAQASRLGGRPSSFSPESPDTEATRLGRRPPSFAFPREPGRAGLPVWASALLPYPPATGGRGHSSQPPLEKAADRSAAFEGREVGSGKVVMYGQASLSTSARTSCSALASGWKRWRYVPRTWKPSPVSRCSSMGTASPLQP